MGETGSGAIAPAMLAWYGRHRRHLPWRAPPGRLADPYKAWLAEIMLQQTTVATVGDYYRRFLERWPRLEDLAAADLDEVLHAWQGLGYYARARNLHACARSIVNDHGGAWPDNETGLRALPGIGAYTAAAIAAIAFGRKANAVDGNIERVVARLFAIATPLPKAKVALRRASASLLPERRCGDYIQALMDLGATICTPRAPKCGLCPLRSYCRVAGTARAESLPRRPAKKARPIRHAVAFVVTNEDGALLLRRRPERGLLGGMMEVPSTPWRLEPWRASQSRRHAPVVARWRVLEGEVRHVFTHFELRVKIHAGLVSKGKATTQGIWQPTTALAALALPTLAKKIISHGRRP